MTALAGQAAGQELEAEWSPTVSGVWSDADQWLVDGMMDTGLVPNNGDVVWNARINQGGVEPYGVTLDINVGLNGFELSDANATLLLTTNNLTVNNAADIRFGTVTGSGGTLSIGAGSTIGDATLTGVNLNVNGSTSVTGGSSFEGSMVNNSGGSTLSLNTTMTDGGSGSGDIDICDTCVDSRGLGSTINWSGGGSLNLEQGGEIMNGEGSTFNIGTSSGAVLDSTDGTGSVTNDGTLVRFEAGRGTPTGTILRNIEFNNNGLVRVINSRLRIDARNQILDGVLRGGSYEVQNAGELSILNSIEEQFDIVGLEANVTLMGENSRFEELKGLQQIGGEGRLRIQDGRNFATSSSLFVQGELSIGSGSTFDVAPAGLDNIFFSGTNLGNVIEGGTFVIAGTLDAGVEDPQIDTINADVTLIGPKSTFVNIESATRIGSRGRFALENGRSFTRGTVFGVEEGGQLRVGENSFFSAEFLTNFSDAQGFDNAFFDIAGVLQASNAQIRQINNFLILDGVESQIIDFAGNDALSPLQRIGATGTLVLRNGRTLDNLNDLIVDGTLIIEPAPPPTVPGRADPMTSQVIAENIFITDDATLNLLIRGTEPGAYGSIFANRVINVGGSDGEGGLLVIRFDEAYDVQIGDSFELARGAAMAGEFADLRIAGLDDGLKVELLYTGEALIATVTPTPSTVALLGLAGLTAARRRRR